MPQEEKCPLTGYPAKMYPEERYGDYEVYTSTRAGGKYKISGSLHASIDFIKKDIGDPLWQEIRAKICHWIYEENSKKQEANFKIPMITTSMMENLKKGLKNYPFPSPHKRMDMYIKWIGKEVGNNLANTVKLNDPESMAASYALDGDDHKALLEYVKEKGWIKIDNNNVRLTPDGLERYKEKEKTCLFTGCPIEMIWDRGLYREYHSPRAGGKYRVWKSTEPGLREEQKYLQTLQGEEKQFTQETIAKLCRWIYEQNSNNQEADITAALSDNLKNKLMAEPFPSPNERMDMYIEWIGKKVGNDLASTVNLDDPESKAASYTLLDKDDHQELLKYVEEKGWVKIDDTNVRLTPDGWDRYTKITARTEV